MHEQKEFRPVMHLCPSATWLHETSANDYNIVQRSQMLHKKLGHFQIWANNAQRLATYRNML